MAAKNKPTKKVEDKSPIGDYLDQRETKKYGQRIVGGEANYAPGDMSKAYRVYQESGAVTRSTLEQLKSFMGGGLRRGSK